MSALLLLIFVASLGLTAAWLGYSLWRQRLDAPNARSSHSRPTPTSGGVGFCTVSLLGVALLWVNAALSGREALALLLGAAPALLGFVDDGHNLSIRLRLSLQMALLLALLLLLPALPSPQFGAWRLPLPLLTPLLFIYGLWQINFYNFMDGIDGLAVSQGLFVSLSLAWFCALGGAPTLGIAALGLASALAAFAVYNMPPARLFMGDVGSNFLGYAFVALGLLAVRAGALSYWSCLILMGSFISDATLTLIARMRSGAVWYHGHRTHAYQLLARHWGSHTKVMLLYLSVNVAWLLPLALLSKRYAQQGWWLALCALAPLLCASWLIRRRLLWQDQSAARPDADSP
ncbi:MAG: glycosyl transferase [Pseudomonadales bacterium]|nr:glycosyl transferase [Pseudomonadales bacterium]